MLRNKSMVVGSTGLVGKSVVNHSNLKKKFRVLALVRNDQVSSHSLLNYYKIDFDDLQLPDEIFSDIKDIYICLGTTIKKAGSKDAFQKVDITYCYEIAKEAQASGVKNISIVTSLGWDPNAANFYLKSKGMIEDKITKIDFDSISIHRPGLLIER
jgi:Predicted nucleoside-diphosphate-sugar epimerases